MNEIPREDARCLVGGRGCRRTAWRAALVAVMATTAVLSASPPASADTAGMREFPSAGTFTFTVPPDVEGLHVDAWGAGGGGSGALVDGPPPPYGHSRSGYGGGGGGYVHGAFTVVPGQQIVVTVGTAGTGGATSSTPDATDGTTGGATSITAGGTQVMRADGGPGAGVYPGTPAAGVAPAATDLGGGGVVRPGGGPGGTGNGQSGPGQAPFDVLKTPGCGDGGDGGLYNQFAGQGLPGWPGGPGCLVISWS
ncbi:glycine-rich domain-containing protein [Kitasatospora sp. NPDC057940]|uniref:glycine-rich domain-containing protein n=1 Tax=Kitasatospora sp. NPDC057940 TaxID=3346285 RepID=UPI0036DBBB3D